MTEFLQDETGGKSSGRLSFWVTLAVTLSLIVADAVSLAVDVPQPAYALLGGLLTGQLCWVAGPRVAQYIAPAISGISAAIGSALKKTPPPAPDLGPVAEEGEEER